MLPKDDFKENSNCVLVTRFQLKNKKKITTQMDVKTAFLNRELNKEIYMDQLASSKAEGQKR